MSFNVVGDYSCQMVPGRVLSPSPVLGHSAYRAHSLLFPKANNMKYIQVQNHRHPW